MYIFFNSRDELQRIEVSKIVYFEADGNYTTTVMVNKLRDSHPAFIEAKRIGDVGIPCYVLEDGIVTLSSKDAGLEPMPDDSIGASCSIDGNGCRLKAAHFIED